MGTEKDGKVAMRELTSASHIGFFTPAHTSQDAMTFQRWALEHDGARQHGLQKNSRGTCAVPSAVHVLLQRPPATSTRTRANTQCTGALSSPISPMRAHRRARAAMAAEQAAYCSRIIDHSTSVSIQCVRMEGDAHTYRARSHERPKL